MLRSFLLFPLYFRKYPKANINETFLFSFSSYKLYVIGWITIEGIYLKICFLQFQSWLLKKFFYIIYIYICKSKLVKFDKYRLCIFFFIRRANSWQYSQQDRYFARALDLLSIDTSVSTVYLAGYPAWCTMLLKPAFRQSRDFIRSGKLTSLPLPRSFVKEGVLQSTTSSLVESKWMFNARKNEFIFVNDFILSSHRSICSSVSQNYL